MNSNTNLLSALPGVHLPQQHRSQQTFDRILRAAERLLATHDFDQLSVPTIARAAKTSVGSFYARFESKDVLMLVLHARFLAESEQLIQDRLERSQQPALPLRELVARTVHTTAEQYARHRGILRATFVRTRLRPDPGTTRRVRQINQKILKRVHSIWLVSLPNSDHRVEQAVGFALGLMVAMLRETIVFQGSDLLGAAFPCARVTEEVTLAVLRYLGPWSETA